MGTPAYMPPEQAAGQPVNERADVYALGAILYHLLAGTQPYDGGNAQQVLLRVVQGPPPTLHERQEHIPRDLLAIVDKAMAREPTHRYATARELAEDLKRFQTGQIVRAYQYTRMELLRRFVRRYRAVMAVATMALLLLAGLGGVSIRKIMDARDRAETARSDAEAARQEALKKADELLLQQARGNVKLDSNAAIASLRSLSPGFTRWSAVRTIAADARTHGFATVLNGHTKALNDLFFTRDGRTLLTSSDDHDIRVWDLARGTSRVLTGHTAEVWRIQVLPDERRFFSSSKDGTLRLWDLERGEGKLFATLAGPVSATVLSQDGQRLFAASRTDGLLHEWNVATGAVRTLDTGLQGIADITLAPDGRHAFLRQFGDSAGMLGDLERGTFQRLDDTKTGIIWGFAFSPTGALLTASTAGHLDRWEAASGQSRRIAEGLGVITFMLLAPDGTRLALGGMDGTVRLFDLATHQTRVLGSHEAGVKSLRFSPDGRFLASGSTDRTARLWDLATGEVRVLRGAQDRVNHLVFTRDGQRFVASSADGQLRMYSVEADTHRVLTSGQGTKALLLRSNDGRRLVTLSVDGVIRLLDPASPALPLREARGFARSSPLGFSPDGHWLAVSAPEGRVALWDATTGREARALEGHAGPLTALAFSGEGRWLVTAERGGEVRLWELASGTGRVLGKHGKSVTQLAFAPDGQRFASASTDGTVRVWDVASGALQELRDHQAEVRTLAFSPDGTRLVTGSMDHTLCFWDLESGRCQRQEANAGGVHEVLFSPDGTRVASRSWKDNRVLLWDGRTGEPQAALNGHQGDVADITFSPDGTRLASGGLDKTVRLWDLATGEHRALRGHTGQVGTVVFLPDGRSLLSTGEDGSLRLWPDDLPLEPEALRDWLASVPGSEPPRPPAPK
jgi:WD40 repeat protein